jgi:predicted nucleic acid-binding protein
MNADRVFVDTNVPTYLFDDSEPKKQKRALGLLERESREVFVSTQVLQELYADGLRSTREGNAHGLAPHREPRADPRTRSRR